YNSSFLKSSFSFTLSCCGSLSGTLLTIIFLMDKETPRLLPVENPPNSYESNQVDTSTECCSQGNKQNLKVYKRRWYILSLFSLFAFTQSLHWNTWPPISQTANELFGWTIGDVALLSNWGPISYILCALPVSWLIETKGLRTTCIISALCLFLGSGVRSLTLKDPYVNWLTNLGQIIIGFSAPFAISASTALSSVWFPTQQRFTATAIANIFLSVGVSCSLFIGPLIVSSSASFNNTSNHTRLPVINSSATEHHLEIERNELKILLYTELGMAAIIFFLVIFYFPEKPPLPPTMSAKIERLQFKEGVTNLLKNYRFWMLAFIYSLSSGVITAWQAVLYIILKPLNISQEQVGILSIYIGFGSCIGSLILARLSDVFVHYSRLFLLIIIITSLALITWFLLMYKNVLSITNVELTVSITLSIAFILSINPILFEMASEAAFPIAEGITNGIFNLLSNSVTLVFLLFLMIENIGGSWMNWTLLASMLFILPVIFTYRNNFQRIEIDRKYSLP
ncbi:solute carrier family 49 member 4 homolog isoform X1, partial [Argonauta hians]